MLENTEKEIIPSISDENKDIYEKYGGDTNKIIGAYRSMQQRSSTLENTHLPPKEYSKPPTFGELDSETQKKIMEVSRLGEYSQKSFDALVSASLQTRQSIMAQAETARKLREAALGDDHEAEKLRSHFSGKIPDAVLTRIINEGTPQEIHELKRQREIGLGGTVSKPMGDAGGEGDTLTSQLKVDKLRGELRELSKKRLHSDPQGILALDRQSDVTAKEISRLLAKMHKGFNG